MIILEDEDSDLESIDHETSNGDKEVRSYRLIFFLIRCLSFLVHLCKNILRDYHSILFEKSEQFLTIIADLPLQNAGLENTRRSGFGHKNPEPDKPSKEARKAAPSMPERDKGNKT